MCSDYYPLQVQFFAHFLSDLNKFLKLELLKIEQEEIMIYPKHLWKSSLLFSPRMLTFWIINETIRAEYKKNICGKQLSRYLFPAHFAKDLLWIPAQFMSPMNWQYNSYLHTSYSILIGWLFSGRTLWTTTSLDFSSSSCSSCIFCYLFAYFVFYCFIKSVQFTPANSWRW
mgnify:CR=1 FL=1